jgi:hypothetical protein
MLFVFSLFSHGSFNQVEKAHDGDLHCVDWNTHDINFILTGYALPLVFLNKNGLRFYMPF